MTLPWGAYLCIVSQIPLGICSVGFSWRREKQKAGREDPPAPERTRTNNKLNLRFVLGSRTEPVPQWWKARTLNPEPSFIPNLDFDYLCWTLTMR